MDRDDPEYASQAQVWSDIGVGVLQNAYEGPQPGPLQYSFLLLLVYLLLIDRIQLFPVRIRPNWRWEVIQHDGVRSSYASAFDCCLMY